MKGRRVVSALLGAFVCVPAVIGAVAPVRARASTAPTTEATAYQLDAAHDGFQGSETLTAPLRQRWLDNLGGTVSYPLVVDGLVYVIVNNDSGTNLVALNAGTGAVAWGPVNVGGTGWASDTFDNGDVFTLDTDGGLQAFDASSGVQVWATRLGDHYFAGPPTAFNGVLYASSGFGIFAVSEKNGAPLWTQSVQDGGTFGSPAVTSSGVYVTFACEDTHDFNPASGSPIWSYSGGCSGAGGTTPVVHNSRLYPAEGSHSTIFDAATGTLDGTFNGAVTPAFDGGTGFYLTSAPSLDAVSLTSGTTTWSFTGNGKLVTAPIAANGLLYVGASDGTLYALNESNGSVAWTTTLSEGFLPPDAVQAGSGTLIPGNAIAEGALFATAGGELAVYDSGATAPPPPFPTATGGGGPTSQPAPSGGDAPAYQDDALHDGDQNQSSLAGPLTPAWSLKLGGNVSYPVVAGGRVFAVTSTYPQSGNAELTAFSVATGNTLWGPVTLASRFAWVAYDAGRVFVHDAIDGVYAFDASTGAALWGVTDPNATPSLPDPPTATGGVLYVAYGGGVRAFSESTGAVIWSNTFIDGSDTVITVSGSTVYVAYTCETTIALAAATGATEWTSPSGCTGGGDELPAAHGGRVYVGAISNAIYQPEILDASSGAFKGTYGAGPRPSEDDDPPPAFDGDIGVYRSGSTLIGVDLASGFVMWTFAGNGQLISAPTIANGTVYEGATDGTLYAISDSTGALEYSTNVGSPFTIPGGDALPANAVAENTLFVAAGTTLAAYVGSRYATTDTAQHSLNGSDGATWAPVDSATLSVTFTAVADESASFVGNADLWTDTAGYNQDIGVCVVPGSTTVQTSCPAGDVVTWKESGGFAGTFSPNAAAVQGETDVSAGTQYTAFLVWKANRSMPLGDHVSIGAGPIDDQYVTSSFSPTSFAVSLYAPGVNVASESTSQAVLNGSDGTIWEPVDSGPVLSITPTSTTTYRMTANADLWTESAGYNQDLGIQVIAQSGPARVVAWKESGGFAGTFSPNAAFVQALVPLQADTTYTIDLVWKANRPMPSDDAIVAGAGSPGSGYSPTTLFAVPAPFAGAMQGVVSTKQYSLNGSNGGEWLPVDAKGLDLTFTPPTTCVARFTGNVDLWTGAAGYNQDIGILLQGPTTRASPAVLVAWKESGGYAGTYSPNAAYVQGSALLTAGTQYTALLVWKANRVMPIGDDIDAGAGPLAAAFSPTSLDVDLSC